MTTDRDRFLEELEELAKEAGEAGGESADAEIMAALAGSVPPPPMELRQRMMASIAQPGRLWRFADRIAELLDVAVDTAKDYLVGVDEPSRYGPSPLPQVALYHVEGGPAVAGAITGFTKMDPGTEFPMHTHLGEEIVFIVQGRIRDSSGEEFGPGDEVRRAKGTSHSFEVLDGPTLIYLVVLAGGLTMGGETFLPGDPRI